ncbi:MAG TPA: MFS transporter [Fimbriiglobus sp.]|nr:MFS transporter [Fimbriiglobus sp.]
MHNGVTPTTAARVPGAWAALSLLLTINLFNYIDRQVLSAVLPKLKRDGTLFDPADPALNTKLGLLTTAFMVAYMLLSPVFARAGDRFRRWWVVGVGVVLWSLASGSSGLASAYLMLLLMRCFVGVGEAAYGPIAPAMISDLFAVQRRGQIMAIFYAAIPVGSALGFVLGGVLADLFDWRHAFWVTYLGLIPGLLCFVMREPPRGAVPKDAPRYFDVLRELRGNRSFVLCCAGMTCTTFVLGGVAVWVPEYIFQREARFALTGEVLAKLGTESKYLSLQGERLIPEAVTDKLRPAADGRAIPYLEFVELLKAHLAPAEVRNYSEYLTDAATTAGSMTTGRIGLIFGAIVVISGLVATLVGGWFGDYLRNHRVRGAYFHAAGWTTILAWPFFLAMLFLPFPAAWGVLFGAVFFLFFNTGPANTILANVSRSSIRATAFAINILIIHVLGDAISPTVIGAIADLADLHTAFLIVSVLILVGGGLWVAGSRSLDADTRRATEADENPPGA